MGSRQALTCHGSRSPKRKAPKAAVERGSADLTALTKPSEPGRGRCGEWGLSPRSFVGRCGGERDRVGRKERAFG
eukprot:scaffold36197_cov56-Isochrysis_galbana.AAC.1